MTAGDNRPETARHDEEAGAGPPPRRFRAWLVTLVALALAIGVLAGLPGRPAPARRDAPAPRSGSAPTSPSPPSSVVAATSTTTATVTGVRVAVLAPAGAPGTTKVRAELEAAHFALVSEPPIPSSWVSALAGPVVRYPGGMARQAEAVAAALGVPSGGVASEAAGTSDGSDVVEVFVPGS
ncbi:MAG TPA: hypothetical protein VFN50_12225 [Acidimicrobiales bacterium]|nr:hypothetical protein [Acidimicrobiales bacterium]